MGTLKKITGLLSELTRAELKELQAIIEALLWIKEKKSLKQLTKTDLAEIKKGGKGHIERKMINGFGPYQYLRYRSGKSLRSIYIGKAKK